MKWLCLGGFGGVGLVIFVIGLGWGYKRFELSRNGLEARGTVVEITSSTSTDSKGRSSTAYYPIVRFDTPDGKTHQFKGGTGGDAQDYPEGTSVALTYDPANPSNAQLRDFSQFWLGPLAMSLLGFAFLAAGVGGFFLIAGSDRTFGSGSEFKSRFAEMNLKRQGQGILLRATVRSVETRKRFAKPPQYVVVCAVTKDGAERTYPSPPLTFHPGPEIVGRPVDLYVDPHREDDYYLDLKPLLGTRK